MTGVQTCALPIYISNFGVEIFAGFRKYVGPPPGFKSKYYSYDEADGLAIFNADSYRQLGLTEEGNNGGMCYLCHLTTNHEIPANDLNQPFNGHAPGKYNPLLTDFTYDNLGIPVNPRIAELLGIESLPIDLGLGGQVEQLKTAFPECDPEAEKGKFKVSTLRNLSRTAPYGHNGFFPTIYDIVHFYNTRDVLDWPEPEYQDTVNTAELGNLGLTLEQEQKLVLFLETLND